MGKKSIFEGQRFYLCGAMDSCPTGGTRWRDEITPFLHDLGIGVLDPCKKAVRDQDTIEDEDTWQEILKMKAERRFDEIRPKYGKIRTVDLKMVDQSDALIVKLDYTPGVVMTGTLEELSVANKLKRPCYAYSSTGNKKDIPLWIWLMLPEYYIHDTLAEVKAHLLEVDKNNGPTGSELSDARWTFFDYSKIFKE